MAKNKDTSNASNTRLSVMQISIMTTIAVASLRGLPQAAEAGWSSIIMYLVPAILFLVPTALVGAELGSAYPGGVYVWVREAFGNRFGFLAVWLQWIQNVVWFPIQLAFVAASFAYMIGMGDLSNSGLYTGIVIIIVYWLATLLALRGGNLFAKVGSIGGFVGVLIPAGLLIIFGIIWLVSGQPVADTLTNSSFLPQITGASSLVLLVANVLSYAGMEMNAVHVRDMENPAKDYTKALLIAFILILGIFIIPTLAISATVSQQDMSSSGFLANGIMATFANFFDTWHVGWLTNVIAAAIVFGAIASVVTWVSGPSRGVLAAAETGLLPPALQKRNKNDVQVGILIPQGIIVTILALMYMLGSNVSEIFISLISMAAALYVIMYLLMFSAAIVLRKKDPNVPRAYKVPALKLIAGISFVACILALIMSFVPSEGETVIPPALYPLVVAIVVVVLGAPPLIFYGLKKPSWNLKGAAKEEMVKNK